MPHWRPQPPPEGGFGLFRFRSPLLTESRLLSFPPATEMFQFAGFAPIHPMHSGAGDPCGPGCPIRKSQDHRSVTNSSGLIAGSNVLHRLSTPRHPPCALLRLGHTDPNPMMVTIALRSTNLPGSHYHPDNPPAFNSFALECRQEVTQTPRVLYSRYVDCIAPVRFHARK